MATESWDEQEGTFVPYIKNARRWSEAGWPGVLPLAPFTKHPPPPGFTGEFGRDPEMQDIRAWVDEGLGDGNMGVRVPHGVIGIDVDDYGDKHGGDTLERLIETAGPLPATWTVTSRRPKDRVSGIRLFRVPEDLNLPGSAGKGIEIVQHRHRYFVAPGSQHPLGPIYELYDPRGRRTDDVPRPDELPRLPQAWVEALREQVVAKEMAAEAAGRPDEKVLELVGRAMYAFDTEASRHDSMRDRILPIAALEALGYPGCSWAFELLETVFVDAVTTQTDGGELRSEGDAKREFKRMLDGARDKMKREPPQQPSYRDVQEALADYQDWLGADPATSDDPGPYRWIHASEIELVAPEQRFADRAPRVGVMQCYGMGDSGKTYLLVDAALSVEYGVPFMGRETKQGKAGFISMERPDDLVYRAHAWGIENNKPDAPERLRFMKKPPLNLADQESVDRIVEWIDVQGGIDVLIIDTQSKATQADEDNNTVMTQVMKRVSAMADQLDCLIILVAHTGWDGEHQRGASTQQFSIDTTWKVSRLGDTFQLDVERLKFGTKAPTTNFNFRRHKLKDKNGQVLKDWFDREIDESCVFYEPVEALQERRIDEYVEILCNLVVDNEQEGWAMSKWRTEAQKAGVRNAVNNTDRWNQVLGRAVETGRVQIVRRQGRGGGETLITGTGEMP